MDWRKSTHSNANGGDCVEIADTARTIVVRDTRDRDGITLAISAAAWQRFTDALK